MTFLKTASHWKISFPEAMPSDAALLDRIGPFLETGNPHQDWIRIPSSQGARTWQIRSGDASFLLKEFLPRGFFDTLKSLLAGTRARRAYEQGVKLAGAGFGTPQILMIGEKRGLLAAPRSFIFTVFLRDARGLYRFLIEDLALPLSPEQIALKRSLLRAAGSCVGKLHAQGIVHGDLRLDNIMITPGDDQHFRFFFIDNERNRHCPEGLPHRLRIRNLVQLNMIVVPQVTTSDRLRFFSAYLNENPQLRMDRKPLLRTIFLMTRKRLQKKFPGIWRNLTVAHLLKRYRGDSPLFNAYVGALPPGRYRAHVCYLSGRPDGNNNMENVAEVTYLNFTERQIRGFNIPIFLKFLTYLREKEIDVVHCHRHSMTVLGALATLFNRRVSVISHVHGLGRTRSMKRVLVNRFLFSRVVRIIAVSESVRHDILATNRTLAPGKVTAVRNGIDLRPIDEAEIGKEQSREKLGIPGKGIVFGTVGRLVKTKGQVYLIEAFAAIRRELDDARLIIIGDGPLRDELREKAENLDILQFTTFTGFRPDALALLRALDIFVFPSLAEGLGLALLEAMASRLPVVATNAGGIPEVFGDSRFGRIVPVGDSRALAAAMKELALLGSDERKRMGDLARKRVEDAFTAETMQREMRAVYESILPIVR